MNNHQHRPKYSTVAFWFVWGLVLAIVCPGLSAGNEQSVIAKTDDEATESLPMPGVKLSQLADGLELLLAEAKANHPILDGVWVDIEIDLEERDTEKKVSYVFRRLLDITHAAEQRELTDGIFKKLLPENKFRVDLVNEKLVPYSELTNGGGRRVRRDDGAARRPWKKCRAPRRGCGRRERGLVRGPRLYQKR